MRLGGQNVDIKGPAKEVAKKMGLEKEIKEANTTEVGIRFVNVEDKVIAEFPKESAISMTQELEILRGDFVRILYEQTKDDVKYIFGDYITGIKERQEDIEVTLCSGAIAYYDLVISAEGIGSHTRKLVFGEEIKFNYFRPVHRLFNYKKDRYRQPLGTLVQHSRRYSIFTAPG